MRDDEVRKTSKVLEKIYASSEASPLYLEHLRRLYISRGVVDEADEEWYDSIDMDSIPADQSALFKEIRGSLGEEEGAVADVLSVFKKPVDIAIIEVVSDLHSEAVGKALDDLLDRELVDIDYSSAGSELYYLAAEPIQETFYAIQDAEHRKALHRRIADAIIDIYGAE